MKISFCFILFLCLLFKVNCFREVVSIHRSPGYEPGGFPLPYPELLLILYFVLHSLQNKRVSGRWFRSTDLRIMGPTRFLLRYPELLLILYLVLHSLQNKRVSGRWFRSTGLRIMGPTRFLCAIPNLCYFHLFFYNTKKVGLLYENIVCFLFLYWSSICKERSLAMEGFDLLFYMPTFKFLLR